jgi:hypothetical protein
LRRFQTNFRLAPVFPPDSKDEVNNSKVRQLTVASFTRFKNVVKAGIACEHLYMATIFETRSQLSRTLDLDLRNRALRDIEPDAFLRFGTKLIPIFVQGGNGAVQVSTKSTGSKTKE